MSPFRSSKSVITRLVLILSFIFIVQYSSADPYYCMTGSLCMLTNVTGPLAICSNESIDLYARSTGFIWPLPPACSNATYQWYREINNGGWADYVMISGETDNIYSVGTAGRYYCEVSCSGGGGYSTSMATIIVTTFGTDLIVSTNPQPQSNCLGLQAEFSVGASGGAISYLWQEQSTGGSWKNLLSERSDNLTFIPEPADDMNLYRCIVSNGCESVTTTEAELSVLTAPEVMTEPASDTVCEDAAAGFSVSVSGAQLVYDWQERISGTDPWVDISSSGNYDFDQSGNLTVKTAVANMNGYQYRVIVTGECAPGVDTSLVVQLNIRAQPTFLVQPESDSLCVGDSAYIEVQALGTGQLTYKWQNETKTIKDWSTDAFLIVEEASLDDNQDVQVLISDNCISQANSVASDIAKLLVKTAPIVSLGEDRRVCSVSVLLDAGNGFYTYSWSNGDSTQITEVSLQGLYSVSVTDNFGCIAEDSIHVTVDPSIQDVNLGTDTSLCGGSFLTLDAGAGFDWYEWSDGSSTQTLKVSVSNTYWVIVGNNNTACESTDSVKVLISEPYDSMSICLITIDQATGKFMLIWERTPDMGISEYNIYREGDWIGSVAYDDLSIYKDQEADPGKRPYRYEMTITDTCGNESGFTPYHIPIFLQYSGYIDGVNLRWEKYQVQGKSIDFNSYSVYKGSDSTQLVALEENIPPEVSVFIDKDPSALTNTFYYRVAGVLSDPCNASGGSSKAGTGPYQHSLSNMDNNKKLSPSGTSKPTGYSSLSIFPNPAMDWVTIRFSKSIGQNYSLILTDISGKAVRRIGAISGDEYTLRVAELSPGYYHILLKGDEVFHGNLIVK
ncbi:MAG TPA: T9SS type A sorting domain-containing protein [Bacteroides sp.]|nr:T9SS type A sorting domain-containing protein [Bacteroides sp.]